VIFIEFKKAEKCKMRRGSGAIVNAGDM